MKNLIELKWSIHLPEIGSLYPMLRDMLPEMIKVATEDEDLEYAVATKITEGFVNTLQHGIAHITKTQDGNMWEMTLTALSDPRFIGRFIQITFILTDDEVRVTIEHDEHEFPHWRMVFPCARGEGESLEGYDFSNIGDESADFLSPFGKGKKLFWLHRIMLTFSEDGRRLVMIRRRNA